MNAATASNTANTIVKRDETGGFAAGAITSTSVNTGTLTATSVVTNTLKVTGGSYSTTNAVLTTDGTGNAIWGSSGLYTLNGISTNAQTFSTTTDPTSTIPSFTSSGTIHTLNIPMASETGTTAGLLSKEQYDLFNNKQSPMQPGIGIQFSGQQGAGGVATFVINATDATITDKGIIKLAGDLTGDADLPRINTVGGVLSSTITTVASSVLSATANNTANTIVKRDENGGFAAGDVTSSTVNTGTLTATSITTGTLKVTGGSYTATGAVLTTDGTGNATWQSASGGITGVGTVTTTSYPNGATISENNLVLAAASSSTPGVLTTQTQTIAGDKTFSGTLSSTSLVLTGNLTSTSLVTGSLRLTGGTPTAGKVLTSDASGNATWSSISVGTITTTSNAAGATISGTTLTLAAADATNGGVLTTQTQTIAGNKTFSGTLSTTTLTLTGNLSGTSASFSKAVTGAPAGAFSGTSIDFTNSNLAYSSISQIGPSFNLIGLKDGGTYTLAWQGTLNRGGSTASFTSPDFSAANIRSLGNYPVVSGKDAIYTFVVIGTRVYYSMISVE